jgi:aminopeptidase N/puromycin-sensitive aminopeptidase
MQRFFASLPRLAAAAAVFVSTAVGVYAQRLPGGVVPQHYTLKLTPDLKTATFTGNETIEVMLAQPSSTITLNAAEVDFKQVSASVAGKDMPAQVTLDKAKEQATFTFASPLPAGGVTLKIAYNGILNDQLRGFYLSKTERRNYAVTQFEPTDARRAFPSFDEPAMKATFDVTLVVDKGDTAISNTNIVTDTPVDGGKHAIHFAVTPKMSTYLVAFLVGDFECNSGEADGVPIRSCATPDKVELAKYALTSAEFILHYYDTYFGIKYPMPKLDMIALPDFEAGAMENFGAITYRETDLLIDEKTASESSKENVAQVVAHEMAHQWFGDMVTMQWWNNLWLNEGFATWMENKPVAAWKPEWKVPEEVAAGLNGTLNLDAQKVTRAIRAEANTPDEINEMFDGITYGKAGAVLGMVENYLGEEAFRQGVHNYLAAHIYGNATAEDFWDAQTANSHKPVDKIMSSLVAQPGEPLLTFDRANNGKVTVSQERFYLDAKNATGEEQTWTLPVCFAAGTAASAKCEVLMTTQQQLPVPASPVFFANARGAGYYRTAYDPYDYKKILGSLETTLQPTERITFVGGQFALTRAGQASIGDYLNLVAAVKGDSSANLLELVAASLNTTNAQIAETPKEREALSAWVRTTFAPEYAKLGPSMKNEAPEKRELRATLFRILGAANDPKVIAEAKEITQKYLADPGSVDAAMAGPAQSIAAANGDVALFDQLQQIFETSKDPVRAESALRSLALFKDPSLEKRALDYAASGKVRNQDSVFQFAIALNNTNTRDFAWQYIQDNWPRVNAQLTTMAGGSLVGSTAAFCSADRRDEVTKFFSDHPVHASERALTRAQNSINACIDLRAEQGPKLKQWLAMQPMQTAAKGN